MSTQQLRQRVGVTCSKPSSNMGDNFALSSSLGISGSLTAPKMLQHGTPQHHGQVMKLHAPLFYCLLPRFLQHFILNHEWLKSCLAPTWQRRYLILLGSFLYKFVDSSHPKNGPKGSPFSLETIEANIVPSGPAEIAKDDSDEMAVALEQLPAGWSCVFVVSTLRKKHYYATADYEQAQVWVNSLRQARSESIRRSMGHAPEGSYPKIWDYYDSQGRSLVKSKERIQARLEQSSMKELEMSGLADVGAVSRGYYS